MDSPELKSKLQAEVPDWKNTMSAADADPEKASPSLLRKLFHKLRKALSILFLFGICAWATFAIYYTALPWAWTRLLLAVGFAGFAIWALCLNRTPRMRWIFAGVFLLAVIRFACLSPSHDREWQTDVAVMPRATIEGDHIRLTGIRDFNYRTRDDFDVNYIEREVQLSDLTSTDFYISYWSVGPVGHTFLSFNFNNADPICISIETRPEKGEDYDPLGSIFKKYELIYVVGEERDLVGSRTNYRSEDVFLYRIKMQPEAARLLFLEYLNRINNLADSAEWYHLLKSNCTLNIIRYANTAGREGRFDIRHLINGWIDGYLYETERIDTSLPFEELREKSRINEAAGIADGSSNFSEQIRASLPGER